MKARPCRFAILPLLPFALVAVIGCGGPTSSTGAVDLQSPNLRSLIGLYNYAANTFGRPPKNEEELKQFAAKNAGPMLDALKLTSVNQLLVSERDGQPFVVMYGQRPKGVPADLAAYEQTGVDGNRLVGYKLGIIEEVDEAKFRELVPTVGAP